MHLELHVEYLVTYLGILYSNLSCWRGSFILVSILIFYIPFLYILKARYGATTHAVTTYWWPLWWWCVLPASPKKKKEKMNGKICGKNGPSKRPKAPHLSLSSWMEMEGRFAQMYDTHPRAESQKASETMMMTAPLGPLPPPAILALSPLAFRIWFWFRLGWRCIFRLGSV